MYVIHLKEEVSTVLTKQTNLALWLIHSFCLLSIMVHMYKRERGGVEKLLVCLSHTCVLVRQVEHAMCVMVCMVLGLNITYVSHQLFLVQFLPQCKHLTCSVQGYLPTIHHLLQAGPHIHQVEILRVLC